MRIAFFTDTYKPQINGVTKTLGRLEEYLNSKDISYKIFSPEYPKSKNDNRQAVKAFKSIPFPLYPECRLSIPFYHKMCNEIDEFNPDIVHLVTPMGIGLSGLRYARKRNLLIASSFTTNFDAYLKYYKLEYLEHIAWTFFKWFHSHCDINLCPSNATLESLRKRGIKNLCIWSRGIDTNKFSPKLSSNTLRSKMGGDDRLLFLYVGRVAAEKDLDILAESCNIINKKYPGKARFLVVGDGPYKSDMQDKASGNIEFLGYKKGRELSEIYASCDVFAFPSGTETFGNVVIEAMASGLPVIAVNSGGVLDTVSNGYNGIMCKYRDIKSFTNAVSKFIENKELIVQYALNAREYALTRSWEQIFDKLISDYIKIIPANLKITA